MDAVDVLNGVIATKDAEIERAMEMVREQSAKAMAALIELDAWRALADDLYDTLLTESLGQPDPQKRRRVMARYQKAKAQ